MAILTQRNDIKPMFRFIPAMMVIMLSRLSTRAIHCFWRNQSAIPYGIIDFTPYLVSFWVVCVFTFCGKFATWTSFVFCLNCFAFWTFLICARTKRMAHFTLTVIAILFRAIFEKLSCWFNLLAFRTSFCLNCLSHNLISIIKLWLEPSREATNFSLARLIIINPLLLSRRKFQWQ